MSYGPYEPGKVNRWVVILSPLIITVNFFLSTLKEEERMRISKETTSKTNQRTRNAAGEQVSLFRFPASLSPKIPNEQKIEKCIF